MMTCYNYRPVCIIFCLLFLAFNLAHSQYSSENGLTASCPFTGVVVNGLNVHLPPEGSVGIRACRFSPAGCVTDGEFKYSFSLDLTDTLKTLTCDDLGQTAVGIWITDAAGNSVRGETFVIVQDFMGYCPGSPPACSPVVQVVNGATVSLSGNGTATVTARPFDAGSYLSGCPGTQDFAFSFSANSADSVRTVTCDNIGLYPVQIWITAGSGEQGFAETFIIVQDPSEFCFGNLSCAPQITGVNGLVLQLSAAQEATLKPEYFFKNADETCAGGNGNFLLSFSANVNDTSRTMDCNDLEHQPIQLWVTDSQGNKSYIETFIIVQDYHDFCHNPVPCDTIFNPVQDIQAASMAMTVFPNPAQNNVSVEYALPATGADSRLYLLDAIGSTLAEYNVGKTQSAMNIRVDNLPNGLYFIQMRSGSSKFLTEKLVILR